MTMTTQQAYRDGESVLLCHVCKSREVVATCERCGGPLCVHHLPQDDRHRCSACEDGFHASRRRVNWALGVSTAVLAAGTVATMAATLASGELVLSIFAAMAVTAAVSTGGGISSVVARRRFLRQRTSSEHDVALGQRQVSVAAQSADDQRGRRRVLSARRGGHDPPSVPPERRIAYWG